MATDRSYKISTFVWRAAGRSGRRCQAGSWQTDSQVWTAFKESLSLLQSTADPLPDCFYLTWLTRLIWIGSEGCHREMVMVPVFAWSSVVSVYSQDVRNCQLEPCQASADRCVALTNVKWSVYSSDGPWFLDIAANTWFSFDTWTV